jgi:competence protein ComEA
VIRTYLSVVAIAVGLAIVSHAQTAPPKAEALAQSSSAVRKPARPAVVVNLNTATPAELELLPGIGAKTAARIIDYRQKKGPFKKIEEIMNVQGIGEKSFLKLKPQLTVATKADTTRPDTATP